MAERPGVSGDGEAAQLVPVTQSKIELPPQRLN